MHTIKSLLYSYADWKEIFRKDPILEIEKHDQGFYYFGANHSRDPQNDQYSRLRNYWERFLEKTVDKDRVVFIEGGLRGTRKSEEEAIHKGAEADLVTLWASRLNISLFCPEPKTITLSIKCLVP